MAIFDFEDEDDVEVREELPEGMGGGKFGDRDEWETVEPSFAEDDEDDEEEEDDPLAVDREVEDTGGIDDPEVDLAEDADGRVVIQGSLAPEPDPLEVDAQADDTKVRKLSDRGNSLRLTVPPEFAEELGTGAGDHMVVKRVGEYLIAKRL